MQGGGPGFKSQWVHTTCRVRTEPLNCGRALEPGTTTDAPSRVKPRVGRVDSPTIHLGASMTPCVRAIQASTGLVQLYESQRRWLLCQLVDCSARELKTDVPSCEKPEGAARRPRTQDFRMGIPTAIASRNRERRELKHLSTGRKRNQTRCRQ